MRALDPDAVEAFLLVAEFRSFTRAAGVLNTTQATVSMRLRRLEERLGQRLLERTPRQVRLSAAGERFLGPARDLVSAARRATQALVETPTRLAVGVTHHLVGPDLSRLIRRIGEHELDVALCLRVGGTRPLLELYDAGELDAVVVLRHDESRRDGEVLMAEGFGWFATPDFTWAANSPLPLAIQPEPCSLRAMALRALEGAGIPWREAFVGTGAAAVGAAAEAGLAVALLARRASPAETVEIGDSIGLPQLPDRYAVMHSHVRGERAGAALGSIKKAFRSMHGPQAW